MATTVRSYAKINLGLAVGGVRGDGFHSLATLYQTLEMHDLVRVTAVVADSTRITLGANHVGVPRTETGDAEKNTAYRIVEEALRRMGRTAEVRIEIDKRLPVQGGMGAGSANAVAALLGLERELNEALTDSEERMAMAAVVGSDVPLFMVGGTVLGGERGESVVEVEDLPRTHCVVAIPAVGVSTALAFRDLDTRRLAEAEAARLTNRPIVDKVEELSRVFASVFKTHGKRSGPTGIARTAPLKATAFETPLEGDGTASNLAENTLLALVRTGIENDFEEVAFSQHPFLRDIKRQLMGTCIRIRQALYAALIGFWFCVVWTLQAPRSDADRCSTPRPVQRWDAGSPHRDPASPGILERYVRRVS